MKRSLIATFTIGILVAAVVLALHATGLLARLEAVVATLLSHRRTVPEGLGNIWQYILVPLLAVGVAWMTVSSVQRARVAWLVLILLIELAGVACVFPRYRIFFQPLPTMAAVAFSFLVAESWVLLSNRTRSHLA